MVKLDCSIIAGGAMVQTYNTYMQLMYNSAIELLNINLCVRLFVTVTNNLREEGFILVHGFRASSPQSSALLIVRQNITTEGADGRGYATHGGQEAEK
jgi:hypothetical protein